jgi:hypothetical protein
MGKAKNIPPEPEITYEQREAAEMEIREKQLTMTPNNIQWKCLLRNMQKD